MMMCILKVSPYLMWHTVLQCILEVHKNYARILENLEVIYINIVIILYVVL